MLPAYGVPKAVAVALQALPAVLPAVALPALRKGDRRTKNSPLVSLEAGRGENQTQQLGTLFLKRVWVGLDTYSIMATISFLAT